MASQEHQQDRGRPQGNSVPVQSWGSPQDDTRKRQRSLSPSSAEPDFYPLRPHIPPPPPPPRYPTAPQRFRLPAPESLPYLVSRKHFEDYLREAFPAVFDDKPRLSEAWTRYKSDFLRKYHVEYVNDHSEEPWFQERYDPAYEDTRRRLRLKGAEGKIDAWLQALAKGYMAGLSYDAAAPNLDDLSKALDEPADQAAPSSEEILPIPASEHQLVIKSVSVDISREELEKHCAQAPGFDYLAFTDPYPSKRYHRVAFVQFKSGSNMPRAEQILFESKINNFTLHMNRAMPTNQQRVRRFPGIFNDLDRLRHDLQGAKRLAARFEKIIEDDRASAAIASKVEQWEMEGLLSSEEIVKRSLDLYLHLLRTCFHSCYYCAITCEFGEELCRKCIRHVRKPFRKEERHQEADLLRITDEKIHLLTEFENINARNYGGEDFELALGRLCQDLVKVEEAGKFRCNTCSKLFKAANFVEKHILNKHPEKLDMDALNRIRRLNNYVLDPNHIQPNLPQPPDPSRPAPMLAPASLPPHSAAYPMAPPASASFGMPPIHLYPQMMASASPTNGVRLSDRIGPRTDAEPPSAKRPKRDSMPPPPGSMRPDPRAQKVATYYDLDSSVPSGEGELDY